jgi:acetylornithine deacetylase
VSEVVSLLRRLIAAPSHNPGGDELALARLLADELKARGPDAVEILEEEGHASVLAIYGAPRLLINAHLDTVPPDRGWSTDPFLARVERDRVVGLGACDIKGAIAAVLCALAVRRPSDVAILFSGDEEAQSRCMRLLLGGALVRRAGGRMMRAVVCEPTSLRMGVRHRGIIAFDVTRSGDGGHSSRADAVIQPIAELARTAVALDDWGRARGQEGPPGYPGMCLNLARLDGGVAFNVVPNRAALTVSLRPPPGADVAGIHAELRALVAASAPAAELTTWLDNAPFETQRPEEFVALLGARATVDLGFWTEAALLAQAGLDAVVIGPGDIAQAHAADEWVAIAELEAAVAMFTRVLEANGGAR